MDNCPHKCKGITSSRHRFSYESTQHLGILALRTVYNYRYISHDIVDFCGLVVSLCKNHSKALVVLELGVQRPKRRNIDLNSSERLSRSIKAHHSRETRTMAVSNLISIE